MTSIEQALERFVLDVEFRTRVLQDADAALAGYELGEADRERLLQHAEMLEGGVEE